MQNILCDPVLIAAEIPHGFGRRGSQPPEITAFPTQVHGVDVWDTDSHWGTTAHEADVVVTRVAGRNVGVVTADCVPILIAREDGRAVAAVHAGWRGMAAGVIEAGFQALAAPSGMRTIRAAVGPAARGCCYEVDEPVRAGLGVRYANLLEGSMERGRPGHFHLDLPSLAVRIITELGVDPARIGVAHRVCTICDPDRFESYRRDGAAAGRLKHFIGCPPADPGQG
jgi:hypothetical protein